MDTELRLDGEIVALVRFQDGFAEFRNHLFGLEDAQVAVFRFRPGSCE